MNKDRIYCTSYRCMIKTCGRHRCHLPKRYEKPLVWLPLHEMGCDMYLSTDAWKNPEKDDSEDII